MSDAILIMKKYSGKDNNYEKFRCSEVVEKAVFNSQKDKDGAAYITSMLKAYLVDGAKDQGLKFFENSIQQRQEAKAKEEDHLVSLFDSTFGLDKSTNLTENEFKEKYLSLMLVRERIRNEAKAINTLEQMLVNCDKEEMDNIFMLQIVMKESKELINMFKPDATFEELNSLNREFNSLSTEEQVTKFVKLHNVSEENSEEEYESEEEGENMELEGNEED